MSGTEVTAGLDNDLRKMELGEANAANCCISLICLTHLSYLSWSVFSGGRSRHDTVRHCLGLTWSVWDICYLFSKAPHGFKLLKLYAFVSIY